MDNHEFAWAAGFFDGEGWAASQSRSARARINQAGANGVPEVLSKFGRIVGVGRIKGPALKEGKKPLYYWEATSRPDLQRVAHLIGCWLCPVKRAEFDRIPGVALEPIAWPGSKSEELSWAGGFFDGEGSTYLSMHRTHDGYFVPGIEIPQAGCNGIPEVLLRFRAALDNVGNINGPHRYESTDAPVYRWKTEALDNVNLLVHRLLPFIGSVKREQALRVLSVINTQASLTRGNPAFGVAGARYCLRGHDKWTARVRPFKGRGRNTEDPLLHLRQCLTCLRERAQAKRNQKRRRRPRR